MDRGILPSLCKVRIQRYSGDEFIVSKNKINSKNEIPTLALENNVFACS